jgi:hypothetical protein
MTPRLIPIAILTFGLAFPPLTPAFPADESAGCAAVQGKWAHSELTYSMRYFAWKIENFAVGDTVEVSVGQKQGFSTSARIVTGDETVVAEAQTEEKKTNRMAYTVTGRHDDTTLTLRASAYNGGVNLHGTCKPTDRATKP